MIPFCVSCEAHIVHTIGDKCPVCTDKPYRPSVETRMALDPRVPPSTTVDEQTGGAA